MANYPASLSSWSDVTDGVDYPQATHVNQANQEVVAIEAELGTDVAGSQTNLKTRLAKSLSDAGYLDFATSTELTISGGSITASQNWHTIDTESDAASDDLDTIVASGVSDGFVLFIRANNTARTIVIKHNTGNLLCIGGADITLDETYKFCFCIYDSILTKWLVGLPSSAAVQDLLDGISTTQGAVLYRNASDWVALSPGTAGQALITAGSSDNPYWGTAGRTVQVVNTQVSAVATGTTSIPLDDTIPQNTEGDEYMSLAVTPTNASNILYIDVTINLSSNNNFFSVALFQDSTANAIAAVSAKIVDADDTAVVTFRHKMTAGTTSATTFKVRAGASAAGTTTFNGRSSARLFGGVAASSITITEILA